METYVWPFEAELLHNVLKQSQEGSLVAIHNDAQAGQPLAMQVWDALELDQEIHGSKNFLKLGWDSLHRMINLHVYIVWTRQLDYLIQFLATSRKKL